jgi:hypothetical protein
MKVRNWPCWQIQKNKKILSSSPYLMCVQFFSYCKEKEPVLTSRNFYFALYAPMRFMLSAHVRMNMTRLCTGVELIYAASQLWKVAVFWDVTPCSLLP